MPGMTTTRSLLRVRVAARWISWYLHLASSFSLKRWSFLPLRLLMKRVLSVGRNLKPFVRAFLMARFSVRIEVFRATPFLYLRLAALSLRFRLASRAFDACDRFALRRLRDSVATRLLLGTRPWQTMRVTPGGDLRSAL